MKFEEAIKDLRKANEATRQQINELNTQITRESEKREEEIKRIDNRLELLKNVEKTQGQKNQ